MEIFSHQTINQWQEFDPLKWKDIATDLLKTFFDSSKLEIEKLSQATLQRDLKLCHLYAHSLKSSCCNVGATQLHEIFLAIERAAIEGNWKEIESNFLLVETYLPQTFSQMQAYLESIKP